MAQAQPSVLLYSQALAYLKSLDYAYRSGQLSTAEDVTLALRSILTAYQKTVGYSVYEFDPVVHYEPPLSAKMNRAWEAIQHDISVLQQQMDISRSSAVVNFNFISTEVEKARLQNAQLNNSLKVLQLYSDNIDANVVTFGDSFMSEDSIDTNLVDSTQSARITSPGNLTIAQLGSVKNLSTSAVVTIDASSNGIGGNNQQIEDPSQAITNPQNQEKIYTFVSQTLNPNKVSNLLDGNANTWFEYEKYLVSKEDRALAKNFNFKYSLSVNNQQTFYNWADGIPSGDSLNLVLNFDLKSVQKVNYINIAPYGLKDNVNHPIFIKLVETSENNSDWEEIPPSNIWLGNDVNLQTARAAGKVIIGNAVFNFKERQVRYIRIHIKQNTPVSVPVGHTYYLARKDRSVPRAGELEANPDDFERVEGPVPLFTNPTSLYGPSSYVSTALIQKREFFNGKRWAIGLRDVTIQQVQYQTKGVYVSGAFRTDGLISRVTLEADVEIPDTYDASKLWVKFYVSPDNGLTWFPISRIQDDYLSIPEVLAFNDPLPVEFRDPKVEYHQVSNEVNSLRVKIEMTRPTNDPTSTPIVHSYKIKVRKQ